MSTQVHGISSLHGTLSVPGDKAVSHRALIFGAIAQGQTRISNILESRATNATRDCLRALGVSITSEENSIGELVVSGVGHVRNMEKPSAPLTCGRSATTMRLLMGTLAAGNSSSTLVGDDVLNPRPMERIARPLRQMGADITTFDGGAPVTVKGGSLRPINYQSPVASAHLHTAILLAGLHASGVTTIHEPAVSRDHSVRLLRAMGANLSQSGLDISIVGGQGSLHGIDVRVTGDPSSAAYVIAAATILPDSEVTLNGMGLNPTRLGFLRTLIDMGADIDIHHTGDVFGEPVGDLVVRSAELHGSVVAGDRTLQMIDEIPIFAVVALHAHGTTVVRDATEARSKDSDRISAVVRQLRGLGASIDEHADGFEVTGRQQLTAAFVEGERDHRITMALCVAGLAATGDTTISDPQEMSESYPSFTRDMAALGAKVGEW